MLDSARHFQSPAFIRSMIEWMAWHKLNVLHWHLTDDQGWRLEIRKYPRLTSVGAWRIDPDGTALWRLLHSGRGARHRAFCRNPPRANRPGNRHAGPCDGGHRRLPGPRCGSTGQRAAAGLGELGRAHSPVQFRTADIRISRQRARRGHAALSQHASFTSAATKWSRTSGMPRLRCKARARQLGIHDPAALQAYFTQRIGALSWNTRAGASSAGTKFCSRDLPQGCHGHVVAWGVRRARGGGGRQRRRAWRRTRGCTSITGKARCRRAARPPEGHFARGCVSLRAARCDAQRRTAAACARHPGESLDRTHANRRAGRVDGAAASRGAR